MCILKRLLTLTTALALSVSLWALPARRLTTIVTQPDGTRIALTLQGDEHLHFLATPDGLPVLRTAQGSYCYATINGQRLKATNMVAHEAQQRTQVERDFISQSAPTAQALSALRQQRLLSTQKLVQRHLPQRSTQTDDEGTDDVNKTSQVMEHIVGQHRGLVILVNFKDVKMQSAHTRQTFDDQFNLEGYKANGNTGSVHDYFYEQSYGQFDVTFDVVGPVTLSKNMKAYGGNDSNGHDKDPAGMAYEAIKLAKQQNPSLNFKDYDWNNDGEVDQVYIIYAGYAESSDVHGTLADAVWPHEWDIRAGNYSLQIDGMEIGTYGCSSELNGNEDYPVQMDGIGSACHEFSHCMGLPDFYDASNNSKAAFGMDFWSIMDYGCYGGNGYNPVGYTSYERWASGWLTPTVLTHPTAIKDMKALTDAPEAYLIYNDAYPDEYYLLENRQQQKSDNQLRGHGLLVLHVDYNFSAWYNNEVNNVKSHQRCTIIPADNKLTRTTLAGDPFPGTSNNTELTDRSVPAATLFHNNVNMVKKMGKPLTNIKESASGLISFDFMGGTDVSGIVNAQVDAKAAAPAPVYDAAGRYIGTFTPQALRQLQQRSGSWLIQK